MVGALCHDGFESLIFHVKNWSKTNMDYEPSRERIKECKNEVIALITQEFSLDSVGKSEQETIRARIRELVERTDIPLTLLEKGIAFQNILDELFGFGPLGALLRDPSVQDVIVHKPNSVLAERAGTLQNTTVNFENSEQLTKVIQRICSEFQHQIGPDEPTVCLTLPNGTEVIASLSPSHGPMLIFRRRK